jgi:hypothetical protein
VELSRDQLAFGANETTKTFTVTLSNPSGAAQLGARGTATVTITDNDGAVPARR